MKKIISISLMLLLFGFAICGNLTKTNTIAFAETLHNSSIEETITENNGVIGYHQYTSKFIDKTNSYVSSDGSFPEYYTLIEGNATAKNSKNKSEKYDTLMIYMEDQDSNGLCWAFAGSKALETTMAKQTNEYVDFSEAWLSLCMTYGTSNEGKVDELYNIWNKPYVSGGGGNFYLYDYLIRNYGVVLEQDYIYQNSYLVSQDILTDGNLTLDSNADYLFDYYSNFATKDCLKNYVPVYFETSNSNYVNSVKKHIIQHGALSIGLYMQKYEFYNWGVMGGATGVDDFYSSDSISKYHYSKKSGDDFKLEEEHINIKIPHSYDEVKKHISNSKEWGNYVGSHAMTIIGWDDTYVNAKGQKGAWILQNSWGGTRVYGNDMYLYLEYGDTDLTKYAGAMLGYEYNEKLYNEKFAGLFGEETIHYEDVLKTSNAVGAITDSGLTTDQKNIYYRNHVLPELTYEYKLTNGAKIDGVEIYLLGEEITHKFNITKTSNQIKISYKKDFESQLECGSYKIIIKYSKNEQTDEHINIFLVTDGFDFIAYRKNHERSGNELLFNTKYFANETLLVQVTQTTGTLTIFGLPHMYTVDLKAKINPNEPAIKLNQYNSLYPEAVDISYNLGTEKTKEYNYTLVYGQDSHDVKIYVMLVESNQKIVWLNYETNGGKRSELNLDFMAVDFSRTLHKVEEPTKAGYEFVGWYYDENFQEPLQKQSDGYYFNVNKIIVGGDNKYGSIEGAKKESYVLNLYAKWKLKNPTNITLSTQKEWQQEGETFAINLSYSHDLKLSSEFKPTFKWFKGEEREPFKTTSVPYITIENSQGGIFKYRVEMYASYRNEQTTKQEQIITVYVTPEVEEIFDLIYKGQGAFTWKDNSKTATYFKNTQFEQSYSATYTISLYKKGQSKAIEIITSNLIGVKFSSIFNNVGTYRIGIVKNLGQAKSEEIYSEYIDIVSISFETDTDENKENQPQKKFLDKNSKVQMPKSLTKSAYTFDGWYLDSKFKTKCVFPLTLENSGNTTLYAKWKLNDFTCEVEGEENLKNFVYDKNARTISLTPHHELTSATFTYAWYKKVGDNNTKVGTNKNSFSVVSVKENGSYYCEVTAKDSKGRTALSTINFSVNILKAKTKLLTNNVVKELTYNAKEQVIKTGAEINNYKDRLAEDKVEIVYKNHKFTNVPEKGYIDVIIIAPETVNYLSEEVTVRVVVHKALATLTIEDQTFTYNGSPVVPFGEVSNEEQQDKICVIGDAVVAVGEYTRKVVVMETENYLPIEEEITINVIPATIHIKAKNIISPWLIGKQKLEYEIVEGECFGEDNLKVKLNSSVRTTSPGKYKISITAENSNYYIGTIEGEYTVTIVPYIVAIILILAIAGYFLFKFFIKTFTIEFEGTGAKLYAPIETRKRKDIKLKIPSRDGYLFKGWYFDENLTKPFNGKVKRGKILVLYAKWEEVRDCVIETKQETDIAKMFVDSLFNKQNEETVISENVETIKDEEINNQEESDNKNSNLDFINSIIQKASIENVSNANNNEEELKAFINKISNN